MRGRILLLAVGCAGLLGCAAAPPARPKELEAAFAQIQAAPGRGDGYLEVSRRYFQRGDNLRARQYLALAEKLPVRDPDLLFRLGVVIAVRAGQQDEAVLRCRRQLEQREDPRVRLLLASLYEAAGRWDEAETERQVVLAARPDDPRQILELARFYQRAQRPHRHDKAVALYQRYLALAPTGEGAEQARAALRVIELSARNDGLN